MDFTFSEGAIDMLLGWGKSTNGWMILPVGLVYSGIYYAVFNYCIRRFNLKTPGREDNPVTVGAMGVMRPGRAGSLQVVVGPMAESIADEIRLALAHVSDTPKVSTIQSTDDGQVHSIAPENAQKWLEAFGGSSNLLHVECVALTRLRIKLGDQRSLSESQLKALGSQGVSQHADGVWHVLVGEQAQGLSEVLGRLIKPGQAL